MSNHEKISKTINNALTVVLLAIVALFVWFLFFGVRGYQQNAISQSFSDIVIKLNELNARAPSPKDTSIENKNGTP